jgi:tetratricopeptide (TPR) repeat protein
MLLISCGSVLHNNSSNNIQIDSRKCYLRGQSALENGAVDSAEVNFQEALRLNPFFAPAYEGLGQTALKNGQYQNAEKLFNKALSLDPNWIPAKIGLLPVMIAEGAFDESLKESERLFCEINANNYNTKIRERLLNDVEYWRAAAIEKIGLRLADELGGSRRVKALMADSSVTRAEFTAVFAELFSREIRQFPAKKFDKPEDITDKIPQYEQIMTAIEFGIISAYPDNLFRPNHHLKRAEIALTIYKFLHISGAEFDTNRNIISDISPLSPIYTPLNRVVLSGVMLCDDRGRFNPDLTVSGYDLLQILFRLRKSIPELN